MAGWQVLSRPSAAEGRGRRPAFTGLATQPYSATEVVGWQNRLSRVSQNRAAVHLLARVDVVLAAYERFAQSCRYPVRRLASAASRIEASPSFVREPEGNGVAERFIRTLKENLLWVKTFDTIEELRAALIEFATRYNETWLVARHGYRTPAQVRADQCRLDPNTTAHLKLAA